MPSLRELGLRGEEAGKRIVDFIWRFWRNGTQASGRSLLWDFMIQAHLIILVAYSPPLPSRCSMESHLMKLLSLVPPQDQFSGCADSRLSHVCRQVAPDPRNSSCLAAIGSRSFCARFWPPSLPAMSARCLYVGPAIL